LTGAVYAESSAVLAWLLGESAGIEVRQALARAELVVASELTIVECHRTLIRALTLGRLPEARLFERRRWLNRAVAQWLRMGLEGEVLERSLRAFPAEPLRALDALHLASALVARGFLPEIAFLSLDRRLREAADQLGLDVIPG
jgi:predicted nucleic acid-binding protein